MTRTTVLTLNKIDFKARDKDVYGIIFKESIQHSTIS